MPGASSVSDRGHGQGWRVVMVAACPFPYHQGSQVFIGQSAEALAARGHQVRVVTYHSGGEHSRCSVPVDRIPALLPRPPFRAGLSWSKPLLDLLLAGTLLRTVRTHSVSLIHAHNCEAALAALAVRALTGVPVVFHTHNVMTDEVPTYFGNRVARAGARAGAALVDRLTARADCIIAINREVASFFTGLGTPADRIHCIPPGIDYPAGDYAALADRCVPGSLRDLPMIFYTGNLDRYQNLELLLEAFRLLLRRGVRVRLVVLTHCSTQELRRECVRLGIASSVAFVAYTGFAQVQAFLHVARMAVLPRRSWSGFPIKLLNYQASGTPVVAAAGSAKEMVHLADGLVVPDDDPQAFAGAMELLLRDRALCRRLGRAAADKARTCYSWDRIAARIESVYAGLLPAQAGASHPAR